MSKTTWENVLKLRLTLNVVVLFELNIKHKAVETSTGTPSIIGKF